MSAEGARRAGDYRLVPTLKVASIFSPRSSAAAGSSSGAVMGTPGSEPHAPHAPKTAPSTLAHSTIPNMGIPNGIPNMGIPNGGATSVALLAGFAAAAAAGRQGGASSIGAPDAPPRASAPPATAPSEVASVPTTALGAVEGGALAVPSALQPGAAVPTTTPTHRATHDGEEGVGGGVGVDDGGDDANGTVPGTASRTYVPECSAAAIEYVVHGGGGGIGIGGGGVICGGGGSIGGVGGVGSIGMAPACGVSARDGAIRSSEKSSISAVMGATTGAATGAATGPSQPRSPAIGTGARAHDGARLSAPLDRTNPRKDDVIVIHVCDDNRRINRDFYCSRELLLQVMSSDDT